MAAADPHLAPRRRRRRPCRRRRCENCGAPLLGEHCYACGQPTKGLVRHFSSVIGDFFDTVFNIDSRVLRTIGPLLTRPGFLSLEYFAGRRVRYVTPMRLFLFLSLIAFFAIQGSIDYQRERATAASRSARRASSSRQDSIDERANTVAEVTQVRAAALAELAKARKEVADVPAGAVGIDIAIEKVEEQITRAAEGRLEADRASAGQPARPARPPPQPLDGDRDELQLPGQRQALGPEDQSGRVRLAARRGEQLAQPAHRPTRATCSRPARATSRWSTRCSTCCRRR